jgi:hypothetical protein
MPAATSLTGTEIVPIVQGGINKKATVSLWPNNTIVVSSNTTAVNDAVYTVVASATFTDPSPVEGKGFTVFIRNGTGTVGGTGYSVSGTQIRRIFHSGSWANYLGGGDMVLASTQTNTGLKTFLDGTLGMRNVANTFTSQFTNTNTAARTYTLPNSSGTFALTSDIPTLTSSNGITKTGNNFALGGTLSGSTSIAAGLSADFSIGSSTNQSIFGFSTHPTKAEAADFLITSSDISGEEISFSIGLHGLNSYIGLVAADSRTTAKGIEYAGNYTSTIPSNDRSIPDMGIIKGASYTFSGVKTFLDGSLGMRNVANTFTSRFTNTNSAARTYTLPNFSGNVLVAGEGLNNFDAGGFSYDDGAVGSGKIEFNPFTGFSLTRYDVPGLTGDLTSLNFNSGQSIDVFSNVSGFIGITYFTDYSAGILANDRSIPDIGIIKTGAYTFSTGLKTFLDGTLGMRNVANTFTSQFTNTNTAARTYTLPDISGNIITAPTALGTSLQVLRTNAGATDTEWATISGGGGLTYQQTKSIAMKIR